MSENDSSFGRAFRNGLFFAAIFLLNGLDAVVDGEYLRFGFFDDFQLLEENERFEKFRFALPVKRIEFGAKPRSSLIEVALGFAEPEFLNPDFHKLQYPHPGEPDPFQN
jgi:hypothetical protein